MFVDSNKHQGRTIAIAAIALNTIILFGLAIRPNGVFKFLLLVMGVGSSSVGLVGCYQHRQKSAMQRDFDAVAREGRILRLQHQLIPDQVVSKEKEEVKASLIIPAPKDWLKNAVIKAFHLRINGQTGSGKSTLTDNAIALARASLGNDCEVVLIDPKYPLSDWDIEPKYKGINEAMAGLESLANMVESRLEVARKNKDTKGELPVFPPILYVVDEIDWIASEYEKDAIKLLKIGLKVGRALNVKVIYIGQTPLCSDLKLRRNDFNHSSNIFLGENARAAIEKEACYDNREKTELRAEYSERISQKEHYLGLIKEPSKRAYFAILPPPKAYQNLITEQPQPTTVAATGEAQPTEYYSPVEFLKACHSKPCDKNNEITGSGNVTPFPLKCPCCGSVNYNSNGSYKRRKRYKCKNCEKTFYGDKI